MGMKRLARISTGGILAKNEAVLHSAKDKKQEMNMEPVVIVILLAVVEVIVLGLRTGMARGRAGVKAPAVTGDEVFERHFRVHYNTIEQMILFVPGVWFFAEYVSVNWAAGLGLLFVVGRAIYAMSYVKDPERRGAGMMLSVLPCWVLVLGALGGATWSMIGG